LFPTNRLFLGAVIGVGGFLGIALNFVFAFVLLFLFLAFAAAFRALRSNNTTSTSDSLIASAMQGT
jgi:hypothetical protein